MFNGILCAEETCYAYVLLLACLLCAEAKARSLQDQSVDSRNRPLSVLLWMISRTYHAITRHAIAHRST